MVRTLTFQKEQNNNWYVCLSDWKGPHSALQMVAGADTLLERIANGKSEVTLLICDTYLSSYDLCVGAVSSSGDYIVTKDNLTENHSLVPHALWLCGVTTFVFGYYPETIHIQVLNIDDVTTPVEHKTTVKGWFKWLWSYFKMKDC